MTRSQTTPSSSQIITLERLLSEKETEVHRLSIELEAAERNLSCCRAEREEAASLFLSAKTRLTKERDALQAKVEAMEKQFPICRVKDIKRAHYMTKVVGLNPDAWLYLAPGAQPAPIVPVDLITDYLVSISAHVAHQEEPQAQAEIGDLLRMLAAAPNPGGE